MSEYSADFQRILDEELGKYSVRALAALADAIQKKGLVFTEELLQSLRSEVVAASARHVASMGIAFEQYGRIRYMKVLWPAKAFTSFLYCPVMVAALYT